MIHIVTDQATPKQIQEMLEELNTYIKVAVDARRKILAGGGALHADCEMALLEHGSQQTDIWSADWFPESGNIHFESLINIRPKQGNRSLTIHDPTLRGTVESIIRQRFGT